ncbi:dehydrogenase/reductase SDR family member 7B [Patella vulgata]|uniref:dehydrogenase/reductase SDR family member 7B n=1 Tax=Patella vulgata TaxID=6465 RepID=UPI00217FAA6F|nr:dehydrogenase/reductase SDR family member 7B [Patella vulgata]
MSPALAANEAYSFYNQVDILINNAGISYRGRIQDTSIQVDKKVMQVNYFGQVALTKGILPRMLESGNGGHIVGISSIQGKISIPYRSAYSASKHAFQAFCDCLRAECADKNINVSVISPGYIKTSLSLNAVTGDGNKYGVMDKTTENGMTPEYVAQRVLEAVMYQNNDDILSSITPKIAVYLRTIAPSVFFWLMKSRARKGQKDYTEE